ncbi:unnamed protein product [Caenorhabditis auriculariae]|uniref:MARVEL domain-containing protein n=1 Tax=Caenorhabditis auriculariae TaxID=2777116 RepID=A0A8S1GPG4_9PELO|nr:unnamed protein product [Caenorhabditis auriculariae]
MEWGGKLMYFDTLYSSTRRGILKVVSIALCFLSIVLVCSSQPVADERGLALAICFFAIVGSFAILLEHTFMLNTKISSTLGFVLEASFYVIAAVGLLVSAILMAVFCASHWADINPIWATMPALAAASLLASAAVYVAEIIFFVSYFRRYSWHPPTAFEQSNQSTVLPQ